MHLNSGFLFSYSYEFQNNVLILTWKSKSEKTTYQSLDWHSGGDMGTDYQGPKGIWNKILLFLWSSTAYFWILYNSFYSTLLRFWKRLCLKSIKLQTKIWYSNVCVIWYKVERLEEIKCGYFFSPPVHIAKLPLTRQILARLVEAWSQQPLKVM